jgi:HK97 family phage portal protein
MIKALRRLLRSYPPPEPVTWETVFGRGFGSLAGVDVSEQSALSYSPVWAGVSTLSRDLAKLPLVLYRNLPNGGREPFTAHKLYRILHDDPNPEMTSFKFRETMQALCLLYRNAYAEIVRDGAGRPAGLYPIAPTRVTPFRDERSGRLLYRVMNPSGGQTIIAPANMIHLSGMSLDGVVGEPLVPHASESFGLGMAAEKFGAAFFGNGSTFGGVLEVPGDMKEAAKDNLRNLVNAVHQGVDRAHRILVLANGAKFNQRGTAPNEAQFNETRILQVREVARWLGMPPHKLGDLTDAHHTNIEEENIDYYAGTVSGWATMWEQELQRKLVAPLEYAQQSIRHVMEGVMRGNAASRADFYTKLFSVGAMSINRMLQLENMNPIGPEGDVHFVPLNMMPIERLNEFIDAQIEAKKPAPPQLPEPDEDTDENDEDVDAEVSRSIAALTGEVKLLAERHAEQGRTLEQRTLDAEAAKVKADQDAAAQAAIAREAEEKAQAAEVRAREAETKVAEATRLVSEARAAAEAAEAARVKAEQNAEVQAGLVRDANTKAQEAEARAEASTQQSADVQAAAHAEAEAARSLLAAREAALRDAQHALETATGEAATISTRAATLESSLQARKETELDRLTRVVAAHRTLIVHAVQRLLKPEVDRARRHQATPEGLRKWAEAFYYTHRDVCAEDFYPAVLTHLAWKRSDENPRDVARDLAEAHCAQSERDLRAVIDGADAEDFHAALQKVLTRWEQERPTAMADQVLHDELTYIRSFQ